MSERVYQAVKSRLVRGEFTPGQRIDAVRLARQLGASLTPVRAALHRLVGERLALTRPGEGFQALPLTEADLRDLYAWNGHVLQLAWRLATPSGSRATFAPRQSGELTPAGQDTARDTASLFLALGRSGGNEECIATIANLNDRLHASRILEPRVLGDVRPELATLTKVLGAGAAAPAQATRAILSYHRRRIRMAVSLVRMAQRSVHPFEDDPTPIG